MITGTLLDPNDRIQQRPAIIPIADFEELQRLASNQITAQGVTVVVADGGPEGMDGVHFYFEVGVHVVAVEGRGVPLCVELVNEVEIGSDLSGSEGRGKEKGGEEKRRARY